jgi:peptidoglycan hydrolase CwlO-like protein
MEAALHGKIKELNKTIQDTNSDNKEMESAVLAEINKLEGIIKETKKHVKVERNLRIQIFFCVTKP